MVQALKNPARKSFLDEELVASSTTFCVARVVVCMLEELTVLDCSLCGWNGGSRDARDSFELPRAAEMVSENFCS